MISTNTIFQLKNDFTSVAEFGLVQIWQALIASSQSAKLIRKSAVLLNAALVTVADLVEIF